MCYLNQQVTCILEKEKSDLSPARSVEYLGMVLDTISARPFPTDSNPELPPLGEKIPITTKSPSTAVAGVVRTHVIAG